MSDSLIPVGTLFCGQVFQSVRLDGLDYYPISELPKDPTGLLGFPVLQNTAVNDLKRLTGEAFQSYKIATSLNPKKVNCITHDQLSEIVTLLARKKDCEFSWTLLNASFNTELKRANDISQGVLQNEQYYQEWREERSAGIVRRREFTDYIKACKELGINCEYSFCTIEVYKQTNLLDKYYIWRSAHPTSSQRGKNPFRCSLTQMQVRDVADLESLMARVGRKRKLEPKQSLIWIRDNI